MIVTCTNCATRLQLDDAKIPSRPFNVRCPKCQQVINAQPPAAQKEASTLAVVGDAPAPARPQHELSLAPPQAPPPAETAAAPEGAQPHTTTVNENDMARVLSALLQRGAHETAGRKGPSQRPAWERRRALVCIGPAHRDTVTRALSASGYEVYAADDTSHAIEHMREERMDVVVLDGEFDMMEQGAAFVTREIDSMRTAERRRLVFVKLSTTARTGDAHAAFLSNVNLIVATSDVADIANALERCVRDLNELYRNFNKALNTTEL
ncbi:MAG TPA: zinc-ribbon domain-containing protein [Pyrinomonadaceae bacterium]|jgi:predicted Zn finger-like uncharacterized protein|nr:zinc-ribbon domain-containing protein [Pyrinomonadaceae bacterium]